MNEKLKEFLDSKKRAEIKEYEKNKRKTLIDLGLYDKVYSPVNNYSDEYCFDEWDSATQTSKYFKKVAIEITDEEYQEVKKYAKKEVVRPKNSIAVLLTIFAWITFVGGFFAGIFLGEANGFLAVFGYWCLFFMGGILYLVIAEIIKLLYDIKMK